MKVSFLSLSFHQHFLSRPLVSQNELCNAMPSTELGGLPEQGRTGMGQEEELVTLESQWPIQLLFNSVLQVVFNILGYVGDFEKVWRIGVHRLRSWHQHKKHHRSIQAIRCFIRITCRDLTCWKYAIFKTKKYRPYSRGYYKHWLSYCPDWVSLSVLPFCSISFYKDLFLLDYLPGSTSLPPWK